jgi:hypothetical protein
MCPGLAAGTGPGHRPPAPGPVRQSGDEKLVTASTTRIAPWLRLHVPLPPTSNDNPVVILRGQLTDGTPVSGRQPILAGDYR